MSYVDEETHEDDLHLESGGHAGFDTGLDIDGEAEHLDGETEEQRRERAIRMGWAPKDQFRGDTERWVDYDEYLRRGEERMPVLQERLRKQDRQLAEQDKQITGMRQEIKDIVRNQGEFERQTREAVQKEFDERKRKAVEDADTESYEQASKEEREWREKHDKPRENAPAGDGRQVDPHYDAWHANNSWYGSNDVMTRFANAQGPFIKQTMPEVVGTPRFYEEVEKLVRAQYPDYFNNGERERPGRVAGSRGPGGGGSRKKTYADLPPAARRKCDEYVERGYVTDKDEYVREYFNEENNP